MESLCGVGHKLTDVSLAIMQAVLYDSLVLSKHYNYDYFLAIMHTVLWHSLVVEGYNVIESDSQ